LGRKGGPFLPNLPLLRHKVAGGVGIMRIAAFTTQRVARERQAWYTYNGIVFR